MMRPNEAWLTVTGRDDMPVPQPHDPIPEVWSEADADAEPKVDLDDLTALHRNSILDFVNPRGFGLFVPEKRRIAGFQPHHFSQVPSAKKWTVRSIELVGLLVHEHPVVYQTANLPRMQEAKTAPTRPLNAFESLGLESLRRGETLFCREKDNELRVLGALRNVEECQQCHRGERGDLLGAFVYQLRAVP
jgi:hypothetical protein